MSGRVVCRQPRTLYPEFECLDPARWAVATVEGKRGHRDLFPASREDGRQSRRPSHRR